MCAVVYTVRPLHVVVMLYHGWHSERRIHSCLERDCRQLHGEGRDGHWRIDDSYVHCHDWVDLQLESR